MAIDCRQSITVGEFKGRVDRSLSCQERCEITGNETKSGVCQCDPECELYNDCCMDYYSTCKSPTNEKLSNSTTFPTELLSCSKISEFIHTALLISKCPDDWENESIRKNCAYEIKSWDNNIQAASRHWPLYNYKGYNFKNLFCGICNHQNVLFLEFWNMNKPKVTVDQSRTYDFGPSRHRRQTGAIDPIAKDLCYSDHNSDDPQLLEYSAGYRLRSCFLDLIDTCPETYGNESVRNACEAYVAPVCHLNDNGYGFMTGVATQWKRYKNPYCLLCHDAKNVNDFITCSDSSSWTSPNGILSSVVWKFLTNTHGRKSRHCEKEEVFDTYSGICRPLACAPGFQRRDGRCIPDPNRQSIIESQFCAQEKTNIVISGNEITKNTSGCAFEILGMANESYLNIEDAYSLYMYNTIDSRGAGFLEEHDVSNGSASYVLNRIQAALHDPKIAQGLISFCSVESIEFIHRCQKQSNKHQCSGTWYNGLSGDFRRVNNITNIAEVYIHGDVYITPEFVMCVINFQYNSFLQHIVSFEECHVCGYETPVLQCPLVTIYEYEYVMVQRQNHTEVWYGDVVLFQDQFVHLPDGRILICESPPEVFAYSEGLAIANIIGTTSSLVGLAMTFGTHLALPVLRNIHGINMMSLTASLFTAQLLPLITDNISVHGLLCTTCAVVSHFAWLAAFSWMSLIGVNLTYAFAYKPVQSREGIVAPKLMLSRHLHLVGWGIPSTIVVICLIIHGAQPEGISFQYGHQQGACWISNAEANLIFFGIPVAISVVLNFILFSWTVVVLWKTKRNSEVSNESIIRANDGLQYMLLFLKIATLMGLVWILGFIAAFTDITVMWWIFVLVCSTQGCFIFIFFALNRRVRRMWRIKFENRPIKSAIQLNSIKQTSTIA
ncbi:uncharacterized protein [Amphiura filiformis]|uniref:uncharacterized protein n=1 Tax=Amphiura filiformis TaxID=82378 RepID=UPI003B211D1E